MDHESVFNCPRSLCMCLGASAQHAMWQMQADWKLMCQAERSHACTCVVRDMQFLMSPPVRLACNLFEISGWDANCYEGRDVLMCLLLILPDNKIVEDAHQAVRIESKKKARKKMTMARVQSTVINSQIFESRGLSNANSSFVAKTEFLRKWGQKEGRFEEFNKKTWNPRYRKLPKTFGNIMKKKRGRLSARSSMQSRELRGIGCATTRRIGCLLGPVPSFKSLAL